ncbi:MAG: DNA repair protein RecO [Bacteroidia bacterium]
MIVNGFGIVLGFIKYGDTSVIAKVFTKDHGLCSFIIQGAYRKKARISVSMLQSFSLLELVYYYKENRQLHTLKEAKPSPPMASIQTDIVKSSLSIFACEVLQNVLNNTEQDQELFDWLYQKILKLEVSAESNTYWAHLFLIELAQLLGFAPTETQTARFFHLREGVFTNVPLSEKEILSSDETQLLVALMANSKINEKPKQLRAQLLDKLIDFFAYHVGGFRELKSLHVIRGVLN